MIQLISQDDVAYTSKWIPITKTYKYEMRPIKNQEVRLNQTLNTCRHLYNDLLGERKDGWENGGWNVNYYDQKSHLVILKNRNDEMGKNLKNIQSQVVQNVVQRVDISYQNFFRRVKNNKEGNGEYKKPGFPRFKGYGRYDSFTFPQYGNGCDIIGKNKDIIRLAKIGDIKFIKHRDIGDSGIPYLIKTVIVKKEIDRWSISFAVETFVDIQIPSIPKDIMSIEELNSKCIGIDMGLNNLIMLSTRHKVDPQKYLRKSEKKLAMEQRKLFKKQRYEKEIEIADNKTHKNIIKKIKINSKNREKQRIKVAKVHRTIGNQRRNFNHNISRTLVDNFDLIVFEKLDTQKMMSNHHYAKSIADASWYQIQMFTKYKAEWAGKMVDFVEAKNTTKECSKCGKINYMPIWKRTMTCSCGNIEDRDIDSSFVIRDRSPIYQDLKRKVNERLCRDATSRIQASGEDTSTQSNEQVSSVNQETLSDKGGTEDIENTISQALPFRAG